MPDAVVDTAVLYAAGNRQAQRHDRSLEIVHAADNGRLPTLHVPDVVLVETMNGLTRDVGHATATDMLERLESSRGFRIERVSTPVWDTGIETFRTISDLSLADGIIAAYLRDHDLEYLYSFDDGFDGLDGVLRLDTTVNPFEPN